MLSADGSAGPNTEDVSRTPKAIAIIATNPKKNLKKSSVKNLFIICRELLRESGGRSSLAQERCLLQPEI